MDEPDFEERKQTEVADCLRYWTEGTEYGRRKMFFSGERFPSLLHWTFGLIGREGVLARQLHASNHCEGRSGRRGLQAKVRRNR